MSSILRIILTSWVARLICCFLLVRVSITCCSFMSLVPFPRQSMPRQGFPSLPWRAFTSVRVWIGARPEFSARAKGTLSRASANARNGYCSSVEICKSHAPQSGRAAAFSRSFHTLGQFIDKHRLCAASSLYEHFTTCHPTLSCSHTQPSAEQMPMLVPNA
uniref:Putative secreted protein n=1 Tax=Ixodes ricinus TaxID=34613 RepID=A0A6B0UXP3_IXORI